MNKKGKKGPALDKIRILNERLLQELELAARAYKAHKPYKHRGKRVDELMRQIRYLREARSQ